MRFTPIRIGSPSVSSITLSSSAPAIAPGIAESRSNQPTRWSTVVIARARTESHAATTYRQTSRRKYQSAAMRVPRCSATSNDLLSELSDAQVVPAEQLRHEDEMAAR